MIDKLHKNPESCTGSRTPETDAAIHDVGDNTECLMVFADFSRKLERERDEARDYIGELRKELEHAKSYKKVMKEQHKQLTSRLDVLSKNNRKLSTLLQEHGLTEYGN